MFDTVSLVKSCKKLVSNELCLSAGPLPEYMIRTGLRSQGCVPVYMFRTGLRSQGCVVGGVRVSNGKSSAGLWHSIMQ
jgi:hypothetical protein